jgi:putative hydroxymethylpyrimidine transport system ATP-binding protein
VENPPGISVRNLSLTYAGQAVFENLSLDIAPSNFVALLGPSGVGKTSLLRIIAGLEPPASGSVAATDGRPLAGRIAYMGQQDLLYPWANVLDNVMLGARLRGETKQPDRARHLLERVGLAGRERALPAALSGGMRQRAALARTLYEQRPVVLMDEPFSALDAITRARIQDLASELLAGCTVLLITHDPLEACRLGHHLIVLSGQPARLGAPISVPGLPPRATDDEAVLHTQGRLMRMLGEGAGE